MLFEIGNWSITKAGEITEKVVPIRMIANRLQVDKENEEIIAEAFNKSTVDFFLKEGVIDWNHQSMLGKSDYERSQAILGKPVKFQWEDNLPVVYANLTKTHPIVRDSILPHLEAEQPVFGSSVGGSVKKTRSVWDDEKRLVKNQISSILWNHLAIAPRPYVMSSGTEVSMVKSNAGQELFVRFSDVNAFHRDNYLFERGEAIYKALEVGAGTDSSKLTGVDSLRQQSLEGNKKRNIKKYDPKQLAMGIKIEKEHTNDPEIAKKIAMDHLDELPDYYDRLERMEREGEKEIVKSLLYAIKSDAIGANCYGMRIFLKAAGYSTEDSIALTDRIISNLETRIGKYGIN